MGGTQRDRGARGTLTRGEVAGDSSRKGKAVELLVAATCILESEGELNVWVSYVDDEGVDLIFQRKDLPKFLAVQVKSRFGTAATIEKGNFLADVRRQTFVPRLLGHDAGAGRRAIRLGGRSDRGRVSGVRGRGRGGDLEGAHPVARVPRCRSTVGEAVVAYLRSQVMATRAGSNPPPRPFRREMSARSRYSANRARS